MKGNEAIFVSGLGKKFCRTFKRSLWYGIRDIGAELAGSRRRESALRKEEFWALRNLSFELKKGEIVGLIGPNGSGKTTLLRLLSGLIHPDKGRIEVHGDVRSLIALGAGFNPVLTGRENILINGAVLGLPKKILETRLPEIIEFSELQDYMDMPIQSYSSGMIVRLGFSIAVHMKPDILLVDEVLAVGDASFRRKARQKMMALLHSGISVLFVSHNLSLVSSLTSRCLYLNKGELVEIGPSDTVTARYLNDAINSDQSGIGFPSQQPVSIPYVKSNDFVLERVSLFRKNGSESGDFYTHEDLTVHFDICLTEDLTHVVFGLTVRSRAEDVLIASSKSDKEKNFKKGPARISCELRKLSLREGIYEIGFYAAQREQGALFKSTGVISFRVLAEEGTLAVSGSSRGLVVIDSLWRTNSDS